MAVIYRAAFLLLLLSAAYGDDDCADLGADMCPEKGLDMNLRSTSSSGGMSSLEKALDQQRQQLDRIEGMLRQLQDSIQDTGLLTNSDVGATPKKWRDQNQVVIVPPNAQTSEAAAAAKGAAAAAAAKGAAAAAKGAAAAAAAHQKPTKVFKGRVVARYKPAWSEHFQFLSAVRLDAPLSCLHILPHEGEDGLNKYVAVGDEAGRLYIFSLTGDLLLDHETNAGPVTAMLSLLPRRNETLLVTGHSNGEVLAHRIWESTFLSVDESSASLTIEFSHSFGSKLQESRDQQPVTHLEMYRVGRSRYLLVADAGRRVRVFRDSGTLYGEAVSPNMPLAFLRTSNMQRLLFLTTHGAASLDLRTMSVKSSPCRGLIDSNTSFVAYAFDPAGRSKAYGVTNRGELVYVALSGDASHFECHARARRKLDLQGPVKLHGLRGYILIATPREVTIFNTTFQLQQQQHQPLGSGRRSLFTASMDEISASFVSTPPAASEQPLLACDKDKVVVLGFGDGYVGAFKSNLPVHKPTGWSTSKMMPGGAPLFIAILVLALAWYFFSRRKDAVVDVRSQPPVLARPGLTSGAASTYEKTRAAASLSDSREVSVDESTRRYGSPSRALGPGYGGLNYRGTAVEHVGPLRSSSSGST